VSQEAVNAVIADARAAYAAGKAKPRRFRFGGFECCILGAAAVERGYDRASCDSVVVAGTTFGLSAGLSEGEVISLTKGWDEATYPLRDEEEQHYSHPGVYLAARALYRELVPQP